MPAEVQGQFGGRVTLNFGSQSYTLDETAVELHTSLYEVAADANQDGTAAYKLKPTLVGAKVQFRNVGGIDWSQLNLQAGNVTIKETINGRTHLFSATRFIGKDSINVSTGEVAGFEIAGGSYQRLANS